MLKIDMSHILPTNYAESMARDFVLLLKISAAWYEKITITKQVLTDNIVKKRIILHIDTCTRKIAADVTFIKMHVSFQL